MTRGKISVTATISAALGNSDVTVQRPFVFQNRGSDRVYIGFNGDAAVADEGMNLEANESVSSEDLPKAARQGTFTFICAAGETADLYYQFF